MLTESSDEWDDPPLEGRILATEFKHTAINLGKFRTYTLCHMEPEPVWTKDHLLKLPSGFNDKVRNRKACTSFGENGTTASVNSYGRIMQISRYFGYGRSGFFCADQNDLSEPWFVQQRMEELMDRSKDYGNGIRLDFDGFVDIRDLQPSLEFAFDRWPRFVFHQKPTYESHGASRQQTPAQQPPVSASRQIPLNPPELSIQYFCHQGSVFQRHLYRRYRYKITEKELRSLRIDAEVCIRNLDFEQDNSTFNERTEAQRPHFRRGPKDRSLIIVHEITQETADQIGIDLSENLDASKPTAAALIITPFADGMAQKVTERGYISLHKDVKRKFIDEGNIDITLGYRLQLLEQDPKWENSLVPAAHFGHMGDTFSSDQPFRRIRFSEDDQFDFLVRRNLEHILSVCCIAIPESPTLGNPEYGSSRENPSTAKLECLPIAITCGDISGHFVGQRTSLSIVQFLCGILKFLRDQDKKYSKLCEHPRPTETCHACEICKDRIYCDSLVERVRTMLHGHLKWICTSKQEDGTFSPHYWASGNCIERWDWLPSPSLIDIPLQLLKSIWMYRSEIDTNDKIGIQRRFPGLSGNDIGNLRQKVLSWIKRLDQSNSRGNYAFSQEFKEIWAETHDARRPDDDEDAKFRLVDHVMICLAVQCVPELGLGDDIKQMLEDVFPYDDARLKVLKRFTLEGPVSKQRTLATCRTATETRFLFHSKDTFLFQAMEMRFFQDSERSSNDSQTKTKSTLRYTDTRWRNTIEAQSYHDEYQYFEWEKPLWYALAFILGCQRKQINKSSIDDTLRTTSNALLDQSFPNGLLPGRLNEYQEPIPFNDEVKRDSYWHATIETLNVLWAHGKDVFDRRSREKVHVTTNSSSPDATDLPQPHDAKIGQLSAKKVPFLSLGSLLDRKGLVEIPDDWLQNSSGGSDLFFKPNIEDHDELERAKQATKASVSGIMHGLSPTNKKTLNPTLTSIANQNENEAPQLQLHPQSSPDDIDTVISSAAKNARQAQQTLQFSDSTGLKGTVIDVLKKGIADARLKQVITTMKELDEKRKKEHGLERPETRLEQLKGLKEYLDNKSKKHENVSDEDLSAIQRHLNAALEQQESLEQPRVNNLSIKMHLNKDRTMRHAKKRIIWLPTGDKETALLCYLASSTAEKDSMLRFFEKHASHEKYFFDGASVALNKWETELHLSFFRRATPGKEDKRKAFLQRRKEQISKVSFVEIEESERDPRVGTVFLMQETISFRFVGDFFDRVWTCHFLDNQQQEERQMTSAGYSNEYQRIIAKRFSDHMCTLYHTAQTNGIHGTDHWKQRKVLELLLLGDILEEVHVSTEDILEWVKDRVLQRSMLKPEKNLSRGNIEAVPLSPSQPAVNGSFPLNSVAESVRSVQLLRMANNENYSAISDNWRLFEQILQAIEDDLGGNIETIAQWTRREEERGSEKPRWTLRDERRYRATITRMTVSNQRKIREIERLKARIKAFRESLPGRLESVRDDISFRGSENINLFTYVTVVFLPLGFATGIFSMSEAPNRSTLVNMVELALIALALTIFALTNAKTTGRIVARPIIWAFRSIETILLKPILLLTLSVWNRTMILFYLYVGIWASHTYQKGFDTNKKSLFESISGALDDELKIDAIAEARKGRKYLDDEAPIISDVTGGVLSFLRKRRLRSGRGDEEKRLSN